MRALIEELQAKKADELVEVKLDAKGVYNELKGILKGVEGALMGSNKIAHSTWAKINKEETASIESAMLKLNQVIRELKGVAVGVGVAAGR